MEIILIAETTREAFEKKLLQIQKDNKIIDTKFEDTESLYFARVTYIKKQL